MIDQNWNEIFELPDGTRVGTGMGLPEQKPMAFQSFPAMNMLTKQQIDELVKSRKPRRQRFDASWIGNQGSVGSCNGYAGAKALERARVMRGLPHVRLSGEGLYAQINGNRDQGSMLLDGMKAMVATGVPLEELVPNQEWRRNRISREAWQSAERFKGFEPYRVETEDELASGLAQGFVGVVAVHASNDFSRLDSKGIAGGGNGPGNHAVGVDDVRVVDGEYLFDMFNSWSARYGQDGRAFLTWRRHFRTTIPNHAYYLIRSTSDDTQGDNP